MGKETSARIQTSILNKGEKKVLVWLAQRMPRWMTSDTLTYIGVFGAVLCMAGGWLSTLDIRLLWLSSLGLVIHWYGDSLDGTLARVRDTQRPVYGFFIDHTLDAVTTCMILMGTGLSHMLRMDVALFILAAYLCLSIYTYVCTIVKGEFRLTYGHLGPTECRLVLFALNTAFIYVPQLGHQFRIMGERLSVLDIVGLVIATAMFAAYITQLVKDGQAFAILDPLKRHAK